MSQRIGRIERVALRDVWRHEAQDFSTYLEKNIDVLTEATGLNLDSVEREQAAGTFSVDLIAEDGNGDAVVIENQLEKSDHDHLGKLLTYLVELGARKAIWIVADPRPEHTRVIAWLNGNYSADFYLLKIDAVRINDSDPAPLLTQLVGPSEKGSEVDNAKRDWGERQRLRYDFFKGLLEYAKSVTQLHANISPTTSNWVAAGSGVRGIHFTYAVLMHDSRVELSISATDDNKRIFNTLLQVKSEIEEEFGSELEWYTVEGVKGCRIYKTYSAAGWRDQDKWTDAYKELVEAMVRLEAAMRPHLRKL